MWTSGRAKKGSLKMSREKRKKGSLKMSREKNFLQEKKTDGPSVAKVSEVKGLSLTSRLQIANLFAE